MSLIAYLKNTKLHIFVSLGIAMLLTRGVHLLTSVSLPDASFALFFIGGMLLKKPKWFFSLLLLGVLIDLVTISMYSAYQIPINLGYLGLLTSYGILWLFGLRIANTKSFSRFAIFGILATLSAFLISTQAYNLFSGAFPEITMEDSIQIGWEYLPQSFAYTMSYLMAYWGIQSILKSQLFRKKLLSYKS
jgi:hypothetical protein